MSKNLLVADIGTQSLRVSIITPQGDTLAFDQEKYEVPYFSPQNDFAEQDVDFYIDTLCQATRKLREEDPSAFETIGGMVIDDFRDSSVILDKEKKPLRPAILWLDHRITPLHGKNFRLWEKMLFGIIGMKDAVTFNAERTAAWWIRKNQPELWEKACHYTPLGAYFNYRITGNFAVSSADCIGHYPIDFKKGIWFPKWHPKHDVFGIDYEKLPPLVPVGSVLGKVTGAFALKSGIPEGTPLYASGSDKACETLGNGCITPNQASVSLGTACSIDVVSRKYTEPEAFLPSYQAPYPKNYDLEVQIYRGLWMVRWFIEQFGCEDKEEASKIGISVEEYLNKRIQEIPAGSDGLILQPYWEPGLARPNARGTILGFTGVHTRYHLYRAILEGVAYSLREGLDEIIWKTHRKPDYLVVSGGGSQSVEILQILADVFNIPVHQAATAESSTLGAAISGFLAMGVYKTPEEACRAMVRDMKVIEPIPENAVTYEKIYRKVYLKLYPAVHKDYLALKRVMMPKNEDR